MKHSDVIKYDIIIVGAGSAGLNIAVFMNRIGLKVLLIEKHLVGGDCLNYGCIPSKALISLAKEVHAARCAKQFGLKCTGKANLSKIAKLIKDRQEVIRVHENPEYFRKKGIDVEIGLPQFVSKKELTINDKTVEGKKIVLATGSSPIIPAIEGLDKAPHFTNESIFSNTLLPKELLVIGGGPIGVEIAQAYQRLGSKVTILTRDERLLPKEDPEISAAIGRHFKNEGIQVKFGYTPLKCTANTLTIQVWNREKKELMGSAETINFEAILLAAGRKLNLDDLDLELAGVEVKNGKLILEDTLQTTNKRIYACGDVAGNFMFTHWAEYEAAIVINNILSPFKKTPKKENIAWVTFTDPEIASFGYQIPDLKRRRISYKEIIVELADVDRSIAEGSTEGLLKLYLADDLILGGSLFAKDAGEIAGELITAMTQKIPFSKLFDRIYPYPTRGRVIRSALQKYLGAKLTPLSTRLLRWSFRLR